MFHKMEAGSWGRQHLIDRQPKSALCSNWCIVGQWAYVGQVWAMQRSLEAQRNGWIPRTENEVNETILSEGRLFLLRVLKLVTYNHPIKSDQNNTIKCFESFTLVHQVSRSFFLILLSVACQSFQHTSNTSIAQNFLLAYTSTMSQH